MFIFSSTWPHAHHTSFLASRTLWLRCRESVGQMVSHSIRCPSGCVVKDRLVNGHSSLAFVLSSNVKEFTHKDQDRSGLVDLPVYLMPRATLYSLSLFGPLRTSLPSLHSSSAQEELSKNNIALEALTHNTFLTTCPLPTLRQ